MSAPTCVASTASTLLESQIDFINEESDLNGEDLHIAKADGLQGALGFYEVTVNGKAQYMTGQEVTDTFGRTQANSQTLSDPRSEDISPIVLNPDTGLPVSTPEYHQIIGGSGNCAVNLQNDHVVCDGANGYISPDGAVRDPQGSELGRWVPNRGIEYSGDTNALWKRDPNGGMTIQTEARTADDRTTQYLNRDQVDALEKEKNKFLLNALGAGVVPLGDGYYCAKDPNFSDCLAPAIFVATTIVGGVVGRLGGSVAGDVVTEEAATAGSTGIVQGPGAAKIVQGSSSLVTPAQDLLTLDNTFVMANRTGHEATWLGEGTLANANEVTLMAHANSTEVALGGRAVSPGQLADELVAAGWQGGTVRLSACQTGIGGEASYGQQLADALEARGASSVVIAPKGDVYTLPGVHGLPQVETSGNVVITEGDLLPPGEGWDYFVASQPNVAGQSPGQR